MKLHYSNDESLRADRWILRVMLALMAASGILQAQNARGAITGQVKDKSGAVIVGASIKVTAAGTNLSLATESKEDGVYLVPNLLPGQYSVSADAKNFTRLVIDALNVDVGTTLTQDLVLGIGQSTETITVQGTSNLVGSSSGTVGTTVALSHVLELPLNDRFVFGLINLTPAAFFKVYSDDPSTTRLSQFSVGGSRLEQTEALIDGVDNTRGDNMGPQTIEMEPPPDFLQEFRVETNNLSAEYGRSAGGVVNAVIKNGTNQFHGDAYEFLRNDKLDASGWGNTRKPELRRNTAGFTLGGPIRKDKVFFFLGYEHMWNNQGNTAVDNLGLPEWRTGNFSTATRDAGGSPVLVPIYDPATGGKTPFPGNVIPSERLDRAAVKALAFLPQANQAPINPFNNTGNWQSYPVQTYRRAYYVGRVDYNVSPKTRIFFRYIATPDETVQAGNAADRAWGPASSAQDNPTLTQNYALNITRVLSPSFLVNFTVGVQRLVVHTGNVDDPSINYPQQIGIPNVAGPQFPNFTVAGGLVPFDSFGNAPNRIEWGVYQNYPLNFIKTMKLHTLKFGISYNRFNNNDANYNQSAGVWTFNGQMTQGVGTNNLPLANTGINLADFLLGQYSSVTINATPTFGRRAQSYAGYFQDDWRVSSRLTLNLGLRYETTTPPYSPTASFQSFNPYLPNPAAGTGSIPAGTMGQTIFQDRNGWGKYMWDWDLHTGFMPRFGFAYRLSADGNTVLRGGFGIFFSNQAPSGTYLTGTLGFSETYAASYSLTNLSPKLSQGVAPGVLSLPPVSSLTPTFGNVGTPFPQSSISFYDPNLATPYAQNYNLTLQHQWKGILFEAAYLGNLGRHFSGTARNWNTVMPQNLSNTSVPVNLRRPFPQFSGTNASVLSMEDNNGISNYHAFTFKSERRFQNGFSWIAAFTWSKWIDNMNFESVSQVNLGDNNNDQNFYNRAGERSTAQNDIPWRLVVSPVMELPFGKGKPLLNRGGVAGAIAGGWEASMMMTLQAGSPFGPTVVNGGANILGDSLSTERPNLAAGCNMTQNAWTPAVGIRGIQYLNPACFSNPSPFTYGSQSRTLPGVYGPGVRQFNVSFSKNIRLREGMRMQLRGDILDLFNTPTFALPAESFGGSNFGIITASDGTTRRIVEMALKLYW
jgi:hypothetical protein